MSCEMFDHQWIADRPPAEEEVGSIDWCLITSRNGYVTSWSGSQVREGWHNGGPNGAIAWQPLPTPYQPTQKPAAPVPDDDDSCVVGEPNDLWMRFDEIQVTQSKLGRAEIAFSWRGRLGYTMFVDPVDFAAGQSLSLTGIEGKMGIQVLQR